MTRECMTSRRRRCVRGLALVEILMSLSITAMLLVATATAVDASFRAYRINQEQSTLVQRARVAMDRLTTVIRVTKDHAPDTPAAASAFVGGQVVTDTGLDLFDNNGVETIYRFDPANQRILAIVGGKTYVLLNGVVLFQLKLEPMRSPTSLSTGGGYDLLERATITLKIRTNSLTSAPSETTNTQTVTLTASVMPRRNVW